MKRVLAVACALCWLAAASARAQQTLDVPFVGTPPAVVEAMLQLAKVGSGDFVVDLGCGDGRLVIAAAKTRGARGYGVDLDANLIRMAQRAAESEGVQDRVRFEERNLYVTKISDATVLTLYLFPRVNMELRPRILSELKPGSRVVSHEFDFGDWRPDAQATVAVPDKPYGPPRSTVYLWIVPASVAGRWSWRGPEPDGAMHEMVLEQAFQEVRAVQPAYDGRSIENVRLAGDALSFTLVAGAERTEFRGRVDGDRISGTVTKGSAAAPWTAVRVAHGKTNQ